MQPKFSAYLDVVRFLAALVVFLGHASGMHWTGGLLWRLEVYGDTCVVLFFVLSGFVIAYVADNKERNWWSYGANRIARLWSVVIPALALTFVIDAVGVRVAPDLYVGQPWFYGDHLATRYLASFFLVHEAWHIQYAPGINQPFWSLSYEAFYYLVFGLLAFYKGKGKPWLLLAVFAIGGPVVLALFPVWMAGVFAYRRSKTLRMPPALAAVLFAVTSVLLVLSPQLRHYASFQLMGQEILGRYLDACFFVVNLLAAHSLARGAPLPRTLDRAIKLTASTTFVLYLFHRPLLQFFSYAGPADPASWQRRLLVIGGTAVIVALATPLCERLQKRLRALCLRVFAPRTAPLPAADLGRPNGR